MSGDQNNALYYAGLIYMGYNNEIVSLYAGSFRKIIDPVLGTVYYPSD